MESETKQVINRAREILERDGWCKQFAHDTDGRHCASGALELAVIELFQADSPAWKKKYTAASGKMLSLIPEGYTFIPAWNDDPETTYEDVMLVFKRAVEDE